MPTRLIASTEFLQDVVAGLSDARQKWLSPVYFYDAVGSALFEAITQLPEYGLTRADERLIEAHAFDIARAAGPRAAVAELGSGSGRKTRRVLEALAYAGPIRYMPIDVSASALDACRRVMSGVHGVVVTPFHGSYEDGLSDIGRTGFERLLVLFLGSTIGNFSREQARLFVRRIAALLKPGDLILIGADLVKSPGRLLAAYDDPAGVTAAFNRNVLVRINRELGGDFDVRSFAHEARWNAQERRVEMHLRSRVSQTVRVGAFEFEFAEDETIFTEASHKYNAAELRALAHSAGLEVRDIWVDDEWAFAEMLAARTSA
jgi:dimethylhistidine N-methyltransferase